MPIAIRGKHYTLEHDKELSALFQQGLTYREIGNMLGGRTENSVRHRVKFLNLKHWESNGGPELNEDRVRRLFMTGDARFKLAMMRAIKLGKEKCPIGIVKATTPMTVPQRIYPDPTHFGNSSMADAPLVSVIPAF